MVCYLIVLLSMHTKGGFIKNMVYEALGIDKPVLAASMNWLSNAERAAAWIFTRP